LPQKRKKRGSKLWSVGDCPYFSYILLKIKYAGIPAATVKGNYAYVSDEISGLKKIDINHPSSPSLVSLYDTHGESVGALVCGEYNDF
jgi:hypothetical protein